MERLPINLLHYGVFMLATKSGDKVNACITNTCMQVSSNPARVAFCAINANYTCELLKESGVCTLSILDETIPYATISHFGMQSGRNVDKLADIELPLDSRGIPYAGWGACAMFSLKVIDRKDLGSHTLFVADIEDSRILSENKPVTYAYYHSEIKPKPAAPAQEKKIVAWKCRICGYRYEGAELPSGFACPLCGHDASDFEPVYEA